MLLQWLLEDQLLCYEKLGKLSKVRTIALCMRIRNVSVHSLEKEEANDAGKEEPKMTACKQGPDTFREP